jgi:hypothetical protein
MKQGILYKKLESIAQKYGYRKAQKFSLFAPANVLSEVQSRRILSS